MSTLYAIGIDAEYFKIYGFWGSLLALKLFSVTALTAYYRFQKKKFINPDDAAMIKGAKVVSNDTDIERVRRAHLNDLENIPIWYVVTYLWLTTRPSLWLAGILIRTFVIARTSHTLFYAVSPKQPHRALSFFVGLSIMTYQTVSTLLYYL